MTLGRYSLLSTLADGPSFLGGNWAYNLVSLLIGVIGFGVTIWQVIKTRRAADAAYAAATQTAAGFHGLGSLVKFSELERFASDIIICITYGDFASANLRLQDLRNGVSRARESPKARKLLTAEDWQLLASNVAEVQAKLRLQTHLSVEEVEKIVTDCQNEMSRICQQFSHLAARAESQIEPKPETYNANS